MTELTARQRSNLEKLATYLENLPPDYKYFDMSLYAHINDETKYARENGGIAAYETEDGCGTIACAVGHGPAAGILVQEEFIVGDYYVKWPQYAYHNFGDYDVYVWCFSSGWDRIDNTHYGAAARIRYLLDKGVPPCLPTLDSVEEYEPYLKTKTEA